MNRRNFLLTSGLLPLSGLFLPLLEASAAVNPSQEKILVLVELIGGNDGLNTLIPYKNPDYYGLRSKLAVPNKQVFILDSNMAMHPALKPLLSDWNDGQLAWLQGVGYPKANRSHFRSINIWETGVMGDNNTQTGWLDSSLRTQANGIDGIVLDKRPGPLMGKNLRTLMMENPDRFVQQAKLIKTRQKITSNQALAHVLEQQQHLNAASSHIAQKLQQRHNLDTVFPKHKFGRQMRHVAKMIASDVGVPIYKVGLEGFDTHTNQKNKHNSLLAELSNGLNSFSEAMKQTGQWNNVLLMTYSEFGRRVAENGAGGTDHGAASAHFVMGGAVNGGLYGAQPRLDDLDDGDLKYTTDFRRVYSTVAHRWLNSRPPVLKGFAPLGFV